MNDDISATFLSFSCDSFCLIVSSMKWDTSLKPWFYSPSFSSIAWSKNFVISFTLYSSFFMFSFTMIAYYSSNFVKNSLTFLFYSSFSFLILSASTASLFALASYSAFKACYLSIASFLIVSKSTDIWSMIFITPSYWILNSSAYFYLLAKVSR